MITEEQQSEHVVAYTADINFLLPSIFSAKSIRQFIPKEKLDIFIFLFYEDDLDKFDFTKLKAVLAQDHIFLHITTPHFYTSIDLSIFSKGHVPVASVGRFFLSQLLPEKYEHIVYLDGDTWVSQDPSALFFSKIKDSCVAFANDYAAFEGAIRSNKFKNYWSSIGKDQGQYYFNSGVFAAQRSAWQDVSAKAFAYLQSQSAKCTYHDQSALNATVNANRICLSLRWNFQSNLKQLYLDRDIKPVISHFTRGPKPWEAPIFRLGR